TLDVMRGVFRTKSMMRDTPAFRNDTPPPASSGPIPAAPTPAQAPEWGRQARGLVRRGLRIIRLLPLFFVFSTVAVTLIYRFVPPPVTPLMVLRLWDQYRAGDDLTLKKAWTPLAAMSPWVPAAV